MKTQEMLNRVRTEAHHVWSNISDQYHHLAKINNPALITYHHSDNSVEEGSLENGKSEAHWGLLPYSSYELDNRLVICMEIPGMEPSDIKIAIEGNELVISGEKTKVFTQGEPDREIANEIAYGVFERRITLTGNRLKKSDHDASYELGVLTISLPYDGADSRYEVRNIPVQ